MLRDFFSMDLFCYEEFAKQKRKNSSPSLMSEQSETCFFDESLCVDMDSSLFEAPPLSSSELGLPWQGFEGLEVHVEGR